VPFAHSTAIIRKLLDDPGAPLHRADLILQYEAARKRASVWPSRQLSLEWQPWWELAIVRHLPSAAFEPPPIVDAGILRTTRRSVPLVPADERMAYVALLRAGFRRAGLPVMRSLEGLVEPDVLGHVLRRRGLNRRSTATELDVFDWAALFRSTGR
jgi:23S rRNA (adenine-N6)-dimethyltransferase